MTDEIKIYESDDLKFDEKSTIEIKAIENAGLDQPDHDIICVFDLDISFSGKKLRIALGEEGVGGKNHKIGIYRRTYEGSQNTLPKAIQDIQSGQPDKDRFSTMETKKLNPRNPTRASTDMSFNPNEDCFIMYRLDPKSNLRFSIDHNALSEGAHGYDKLFTHVQRISEDGKVWQNEPEFRVTSGLMSNANAVIVACNKSRVTMPQQGEPDILARLNLHIDVIGSGHSKSDSYIPIIIDPDVRFPGGNGGG
ncbi:hypothetical protein QWY75_13575 [Pontixanthobacter aestiaquae]|uniref:Uncharacterized protein n=1 Tax=Pontixanthobacter aestiaquae TaxID=1509367 RepID=A0A844Z294_9SPHN|nr:hypothetical protein [Pontixanthobacter aestiaquae]MDN3647236.1 hypothetical protein [Pontixanthobacter aestiaquae]MXO81788.1 hypothetical protein [Pontixanthobacter aestiaquae]